MTDIVIGQTRNGPVGTDLLGDTFNPDGFDPAHGFNDYIFQARTPVPTVHGIRAFGGHAAVTEGLLPNGPGGTGVIGIGGDATERQGAGHPGGGGVFGQGGNGVGQQSPGAGVVGQGGKGNADGVQGHGSGEFSGVAGFGDPASNTGTGVFGLGGGGNGPGVRGIGAGGPNTSPNAPVGVYGQAGNETDGVLGVGGTFLGQGFAVGSGVHGLSIVENGTGVIGEANRGSLATGIFGVSGTGFAGLFAGKVHIDGDLEVTGKKAAVVPFPDGSHRRLYCLESPESWFEDFGFGQLVNGQAQIQLAPDFAAVVNSDTYHVFITEYEDNNALYVTRRSSTGFEVHAKASTANGAFSYRVVAKRKDITPTRLEKVTLPEKRSANL